MRLVGLGAGEYPDTKVAQCAAAGVVLEKAMAGIVWNGVQQKLVAFPTQRSTNNWLVFKCILNVFERYEVILNASDRLWQVLVVRCCKIL